jgi:Secretion system C-terminal sorting domain
MVLRYTFIAFIGIFSFLLISAGVSSKSAKVSKYKPEPTFSGGPGSGGLGDRTGSPLSSGSCTQCHFGGTYSPAISIQVTNGLSPVTSYVPGTTYTVVYTVTGGAPRYGFQGVALRTNNTAGGTFNTPGANTQIVSIGGIPYVEHTGAVATTGVFTSQWTAPSAGVGSIVFYGRGMASNANGSTNGDNITSSVSLTLTQVVPTTVSYPGNPFCVNEPSQTPVVTGTAGGTYSSTAGLSINPSNGVVNVGTSTPGTYIVTYAHANGVSTASITIHPTASSSFALTICNNETYNFGSLVLDGSDAGLHTQVFQTTNGCDSTVQLNLSVIPAVLVSQSATICDNETFVFYGQTLNAANAGLNSFVLIAANGCDSTVQLNLTVNPTITVNQSATICVDDTFLFNGQTLTSANAGLNTAVLQSAQGCDSSINLTLIVETIDNTVTANGATLTSNQAGATYQWIDCDNGNAPIAGATSASFTPTSTGNYAAVVTVNNCSDTTACTLVDFNSIEELNSGVSLIFPNPVSDVFEIKNIERFGSIESIVLMDAKGRAVMTLSTDDASANISHLESGVYFLNVRSEPGNTIISVVKK